jgi:catechol 2,3-dioxygenase-like lactoylglutathione lyase family enzyme
VTAIAEIALFTRDVDGVSAFYRDLLGEAPVAAWPGGALFAAGSAKILVHERMEPLEGGPPNEDHHALAVVRLDETCAALRSRGLAFLVEPREYPWGRSAYLCDPDGRLVELAEA